MHNDRPVEDPRLQKALDEMKRIMHKYKFAGACMVISPDEAAFFYAMHAPWSAITFDSSTPLGFRFRANSKIDGPELAHQKVEAAMHTICQLEDFGNQTVHWMSQLKTMLQRAGIEFEHTPFGGKTLPDLTNQL